MNKRHYEHTLPNIRGSLSNTYENGDYGRKIGKIIPYYGNTMDCACAELRTFAA